MNDDNLIDFQAARLVIVEEVRLETKQRDRFGEECKHKQRVVDPKLRRVTCKACHVQLDPIEVLIEIVSEWGEWRTKHLVDTVNRYHEWERRVTRHQERNQMTEEERKMSPAEVKARHSQNGCPRERMWFKRDMIKCYCGVSWNRHSFPVLAQEVEKAHRAVAARTKIREAS
jgi:hypothetical protein